MGNYRVGRNKPPKSTRFKKGKSGNPSGRPRRKAHDLTSVLNKVLNQKIAVRENGRNRSLTIREAMLRTITTKGLQGDTKALAALLTMQERLDKKRPPETVAKIDPDEIEILRHHLPHLQRMLNGKDSTD